MRGPDFIEDPQGVEPDGVASSEGKDISPEDTSSDVPLFDLGKFIDAELTRWSASRGLGPANFPRITLQGIPTSNPSSFLEDPTDSSKDKDPKYFSESYPVEKQQLEINSYNEKKRFSTPISEVNERTTWDMGQYEYPVSEETPSWTFGREEPSIRGYDYDFPFGTGIGRQSPLSAAEAEAIRTAMLGLGIEIPDSIAADPNTEDTEEVFPLRDNLDLSGWDQEAARRGIGISFEAADLSAWPQRWLEDLQSAAEARTLRAQQDVDAMIAEWEDRSEQAR